MIDACIAGLLRYAEDTGLIEADDRLWARNRLLEALQLDGCDPDCAPAELPLADLLRELTEDAVSRGVAQDNSVARDLFDTKLMGVLTPAPHEVRAKFRSLYAVSPERATDWFYAFSQNTNYIRRDRIARDQKWVYESAYGPLDITINLSKPEKDPKAIAAAKAAPQTSYPKCQLCRENEGYAGRLNHPARQNHRIIPITINQEDWFLQYSPYVYYNEHCIVLNGQHTPMKIDKATFRKLLDFAQAGDNVGALLRGIQRNEIERGQVLSKPGSIHPHTKFAGQVYILKKEEGGRHTPFFNNYRPQFYFRTTDVTGVITLPEGTEMCMPGDNVSMDVELITPIAIEEGLRFAIREGGRTVGSGVVTKINE